MDTKDIADMIEGGRHLVPGHMWGGVQRYFLNGIPPGDFLSAVLSNDLMEAFGRADHENTAAMRKWCQFLYGHAPRGSYGSTENFRSWMARFEEKAT